MMTMTRRPICSRRLQFVAGTLALTIASALLTAQPDAGPAPATVPAATAPTTIPSASGLKIEERGRVDLDYAAREGDRVTVLYTGWLAANGQVFDSSFANPEMPRAIVLVIGEHSVIRGWELGLLGMKLGETRRLIIPPELAYGEAGSQPLIPPNATLMFEVTIVKIEPRQ